MKPLTERSWSIQSFVRLSMRVEVRDCDILSFRIGINVRGYFICGCWRLNVFNGLLPVIIRGILDDILRSQLADKIFPFHVSHVFSSHGSIAHSFVHIIFFPLKKDLLLRVAADENILSSQSFHWIKLSILLYALLMFLFYWSEVMYERKERRRYCSEMFFYGNSWEFGRENLALSKQWVSWIWKAIFAKISEI